MKQLEYWISKVESKINLNEFIADVIDVKAARLTIKSFAILTIQNLIKEPNYNNMSYGNTDKVTPFEIKLSY